MNDYKKHTLALNKTIDQVIESYYSSHKKQAPCQKGCASCCSQFFEISGTEFSIISSHIETLTPMAQTILRIKSEE
ncbi:MAG: hypothetical protein PF505_05960 [Vallitaleaceae bacterium]|jgi:hypothetical protein|nr:hypothetical protein [Vallitaleaceae bacterium]